ncbi:glycosyltransferase family 2 protein [Candidatus Formimonas warabiya]|uniref:Glycosyltransferase 2-like domain-containing protein n=1 Tax=Formimonas warabiya TaxID=1761012 RepID=A0A3G1KNS4_FORW1|nr:glycosyltransferase family 2 protein [Candidatus Formimonas warabiya]ATW24070.1 hypothetical protein DCMF_04060 [Candidatus Formimonas warabiya]
MMISVIIPAYNAGKKIHETVQAIKNTRLIDEIFVVDDGSKDDTADQAASAGAKILRHHKNLGKGSALNTAAGQVQGDVIVLLDADLGESAQKFTRLLSPIFANEADVTLAKFPPPPVPGGFGLVKKLAAAGTWRLTGRKISCPLSGQRAMTKQVFTSILPFARGYGVEVAANVDILKNGWRLKEVEIEMVHDFSRRDFAGFMHRGRQFYDIFRTLVQKSLGE